MSENLQPAWSKSLLSLTTLITSASSAAITLPLADSYTFIMEVSGSISGTSETLDMAIQTSPDGGTTYYDHWRFAQVTTAAVTRCLTVQPIQGRGEAGSEAAVTAAGTGAISSNKPFANPIKLTYTVGGTSPSYAVVKVWVIAQIRATAV